MLAQTTILTTSDLMMIGGIAGGILAFFHACISIGDRLWGKAKAAKEAAQQSAACKYDHTRICESSQRLEDSMQRLVTVVGEAVAKFIETTNSQAQIQQVRHEELRNLIQQQQHKR